MIRNLQSTKKSSSLHTTQNLVAFELLKCLQITQKSSIFQSTQKIGSLQTAKMSSSLQTTQTSGVPQPEKIV